MGFNVSHIANDKLKVEVTGTVPKTDVDVKNFPANQAVTVTNLPDTQKVSDAQVLAQLAILETELENVNLKLSGTQNVAGSVNVSNFPTTQAITVATLPKQDVDVKNFPATQAVTGTVSVSNFPATQTVAFPAGTPQSVTVSNFPATQNVSVTSIPEVEVKNDSGNPLAVKIADNDNVTLGAKADTAVTNPASAASVTALLKGLLSQAQGGGTGSAKVSVQNYPATQAVSGSVTVSNLPATQAVSGSVSVSNFPSTQTIAGTVNIGNLPATQNVADANTVAKLTQLETKLTDIDTKLTGILKTEITNKDEVLFAQQPFSGSANTNKTFTSPMKGFAITNDAAPGGANLTFTINSMTWTVHPQETFNELVGPFSEVAIATTVPFRAHVKGPSSGSSIPTTPTDPNVEWTYDFVVPQSQGYYNLTSNAAYTHHIAVTDVYGANLDGANPKIKLFTLGVQDGTPNETGQELPRDGFDSFTAPSMHGGYQFDEDLQQIMFQSAAMNPYYFRIIKYV